jgi:hypothetical protein
LALLQGLLERPWFGAPFSFLRTAITATTESTNSSEDSGRAHLANDRRKIRGPYVLAVEPTMWIVLTVIAVFSLIAFWKGPNAVGGGLTLGAIGGFIAAFISFLAGNGFHWSIVGKWIVICVVVGLSLELSSRLFGRLTKAAKQHEEKKRGEGAQHLSE